MEEKEKKTVYSIHEVAKICKVSPRTAITWFDKGLLRGYRIHGSQERRIPTERLITFMQEQGIGIPAEFS